MASQAER